MHFWDWGEPEVFFVVVAVEVNWFLVLEEGGDDVEVVDEVEDYGLEFQGLELADCWQQFGEA